MPLRRNSKPPRRATKLPLQPHRREPGGVPGSFLRCCGLLRSHFPVKRGAVVLVPLHFPISILPRVIAELRSILEHLFGDVGAEARERGVVMQRAPGNWVVAVI